MRLLVTAMGSTAGQNLLWAMHRAPGDTFVLGVDARAEHGGLGLANVDACVPVGDDPAYIEALAALVARYRIDVLVPVMEPELVAVASRHEELERLGVALIVSPPATLDVCLSKRRLAAALADLGLATPDVYEADVPRFPVFARPDRSTGGYGAMRVDDVEMLTRLRAADPDVVVTEYIDGLELSIDGFALASGRLAHAIARTRDETKGGLAVRSTVVDLGDRRDEIEKIVQGLGLFGLFNAQCRIGADGTARYFDVNPRPGGGMVLSFAAGLDLRRLLEATLGHHAESPSFETRIGTRLLRRWHNVITDPDTASGRG